MSLFIAKYCRKLKIGADIKRKKSKKDDRVCEKNKEGVGES